MCVEELKNCSRSLLFYYNSLNLRNPGESCSSCSDVLLRTSESLRAELTADLALVEEDITQVIQDEEVVEEDAENFMEFLTTQRGLKWLCGTVWLVFTMLWIPVVVTDLRVIFTPKYVDFSGTYAIVVAPSLSCNLSKGRAWLDLYPGVAIDFPPSDPKAPASCWQAGGVALALIDMGLNGTIVFRDTSLSVNLPHAILKAERSPSHKRTAVITFNHALSQHLVRRPWIENLLGVQPPDVRWASVGNNLFHDRLAKDAGCHNRSNCGCSDPDIGYIDCLAGVFDLVTMATHVTTDDLHRTIQASRQTGPHELPAASFANDIIAGVNKSDRRGSSEKLRILVDCGHRFADLPNKKPEDLLDMLFAGVYKYQSNQLENRTIITTLLNCKDDRATIVKFEKTSHTEFLSLLASSDIYTSVIESPTDHVGGMPEAQIIGVPILSLGGIVEPELFQEGVTGFTVSSPENVQFALESIEQSLGNNQWRTSIHEWAQHTFSARKATEQILSHLFELPLIPPIKIAH